MFQIEDVSKFQIQIIQMNEVKGMRGMCEKSDAPITSVDHSLPEVSIRVVLWATRSDMYDCISH